jgi:two-component system, response regulator PdtaR
MNTAELAGRADAVRAVLLVEADDPTRASAADMLRACGCRVLEAGSAEAALQTLRQHHDVALLMADVTLPGESGLVFAARARQMRPHLPVVLTAGADLPEDSPGGGGPLVLRKPYGIEALRAVLREAATR